MNYRKPLTASARYHHGGQVFEKPEILNDPAHGPVFSGPHQPPSICETATAGLGAAPESPSRASRTRGSHFRTPAIPSVWAMKERTGRTIDGEPVETLC